MLIDLSDNQSELCQLMLLQVIAVWPWGWVIIIWTKFILIIVHLICSCWMLIWRAFLSRKWFVVWVCFWRYYPGSSWLELLGLQIKSAAFVHFIHHSILYINKKKYLFQHTCILSFPTNTHKRNTTIDYGAKVTPLFSVKHYKDEVHIIILKHLSLKIAMFE